jgi:hypothetical protein
MPKKKKKVKVVYRDSSQGKPLPKALSDLEELRINPPRNVDPETRKDATERLVRLFKAVSEAPEPILDMLYRLEIPWRRTDLIIDNAEEPYIIIKASELEAGEVRHQASGSLVNKLYGDKIAERMNAPIEFTEPAVESEYYETQPIPEYEFVDPITVHENNEYENEGYVKGIQ